MKLLVLVYIFHVADIYKTFAAPASTYNQQQTGDLNVRVDLKDIQIVAIVGEGLLEDFGEYDYHYDYSDFTLKPVIPHSTTSASSSTAVSSTSIKPWHTWPTVSPVPATSEVTEIAAEKPLAASSVAAEHVTVNILISAESEDDVKPKKNSSSSATSSPEDAQGTAIINASDKVPSALPEPQVTPTLETIRVNEKVESADDPAKEKDPVVAIPATTELQQSGEHPAPETSETSVDQTQTQPLRKCSPGYSRDQKGRCSRVHNRRRIPSSLLPFGIRLTPKIYRQRDHESNTSEN